MTKIIRPYAPHELDTHPDCVRIRATIAGIAKELEIEIETLKGELEQSEAQVNELKTALTDAETEIRNRLDKISELCREPLDIE